MIEIPIEFLAVFFIFLIWFFWMLWNKLSLRKFRRRYKPEDDLSKKGEEKQRRDRDESERDRRNENESIGASGSSEPKGRSSVQERTPDAISKNSRSIRRNWVRRRIK